MKGIDLGKAVKRTINYDFLLANCDLTIAKKCSDSLETFINEGLVIKESKLD